MNEIDLIEPMHKAWRRTKWILFSPFHASKWFLIAFPAWLAYLWNRVDPFSQLGGNLGPLYDQAEAVQLFIENNRVLVVTLLAVFLLMISAAMIALLWAGSRSHFVLLDQVVQNQTQFAKPWNKYRAQGHSLFFWRLGFGLFTTIVLLLLIGLGLWSAWPAMRAGRLDASFWTAIATCGLLVLLFSILTGFIRLLVEHFIVPIMYKHQLDILTAWKSFRPWFKGYFWCFAAYGLLAFVLLVNVAALTTLIGLLTCCCGFILLGIPYLGTVLLLPVYVFFRALGPEFLAQFSDDLDLFIVDQT